MVVVLVAASSFPFVAVDAAAAAIVAGERSAEVVSAIDPASFVADDTASFESPASAVAGDGTSPFSCGFLC